MTDAETEFLLISEAVARLEEGMFGGEIRRPKAVETAKKTYPGASTGWALHRHSAVAIVDAAIMSADLSVNVFLPSGDNGRGQPLRVPIEILGRLKYGSAA